MKKVIAITLVSIMTLSLAGCAVPAAPAASAPAPAPEKDMVYAVEAGSAGEQAAQDNGFKINSVASQADALMEVAAGTSDAAIIDLLMAGAMIGAGTSYPNLTHTDELTKEEYGVGCRKGSDLADYINYIFSETYKSHRMQETATIYGVQESLVEQPDLTEPEISADGDIAYIQGKGTLIIGVTDFEPMDYKDENAENGWAGFDADMAKYIAYMLGVEPQFVEIDWDNKIMELDSKNIDVVWNGMTLTDEVTNAMQCTNPYCNNAQVIVVPEK